MMRRIVGIVLIAASLMVPPALATQGIVNPALTHNLAARPKKVVLPPPLGQSFMAPASSTSGAATYSG